MKGETAHLSALRARVKDAKKRMMLGESFKSSFRKEEHFTG